MKRLLGVLLFALVATSLPVATSGADVVSHEETDVLELEPAGDGVYTQVDDETGEIRIVATGENPALNGEGVNDDALTDLGPVFVVENALEADSEATVWIEDGSGAVEFYEPGTGTIEREDEGAELKPGDAATVAMRVDTRGVEDVALDGIKVLATLEPAVDEGGSGPPDARGDDATENGDLDDGEAANSVRSPEPTATPRATETLTPPSESSSATSTPGTVGGGTATPILAESAATESGLTEAAGFDLTAPVAALVALLAGLALLTGQRYRW